MTRLPVIGPKSRPGDKRRREELAALYAELPTLACQGKCAESCGPIWMSRIEWQSVCRAVGDERKATGITCPILENDRCAAYDVRPMLCRLWGIVEGMPCIWGCKPDPGYLTDAEGHEFLRRAAMAGL